MSNTSTETYDQDFYAWAIKNAKLLREGKLSEIDGEHIAEELEDVGKSERRALESHLRNVTLHLLKWQFQPGLRGVSWRQSIRNGRIAIDKILYDSSSLKGSLPAMLISEYPPARADAIDETGLIETIFPQGCPFSLEQVLDHTFWPD
jgi:hypothetical protein